MLKLTPKVGVFSRGRKVTKIEHADLLFLAWLACEVVGLCCVQSKAARQQGSKAALQQGSKAARQPGSKPASQQGSKATSQHELQRNRRVAGVLALLACCLAALLPCWACCLAALLALR